MYLGSHHRRGREEAKLVGEQYEDAQRALEQVCVNESYMQRLRLFI